MKRILARFFQSGSSHWIAVVAVLVSVISLGRDCRQDNKIMELQSVTKAMTFRPRLSLKRAPLLSGFELHGTLSGSVQDTSIWDAALTINYSATLMNTGNASARVVATAWSDTVTGLPVGRTILRDRSLRERCIHFRKTSDFYPQRDVQPFDSVRFEFQHGIGRSDSSTFVVHLMFLYENEAGDLYDTYYSARYRLAELCLPTAPMRRTKEHELEAKVPFKLEQLLKFVDANESSDSYSRPEADGIRKAIRNAS